ncbi:MAG: DUF3179 domain-containing protein [Bacteroidota bacterium]
MIFTILICCFQIVSCTDDSNPAVSNSNNTDWLINQQSVFNGAPRDGIPSIDDPKFTPALEVDFLEDDALIMGIQIGEDIRAYPHPILDWHEIVNDRLGGVSLAVTYCPLTGTGIAWERVIGGRETTFGVSGLLFNSNLMPYDRETNSIWSQQRLDCVNGDQIGTEAVNYSLLETNWKIWREAYPESDVLNTNTSFSRDYQLYPYGDFRTNDSRLLFPVDTQDGRLPGKQRVLGVLANDEAKAYLWQDVEGPQLVRDNIAGQDIVVVRDRTREYIVAFEVTPSMNVELVDNEFPVILKDTDGNQYDILGYSEQTETVLQKPIQFMGYWFSWGTFYSGLEIVD